MSAKLLKILGIIFFIIISIIGVTLVWVYTQKDEIFKKVKETVDKNINGELKIRDFQFKPFSGGYGLNFTLFDVELTDTLYRFHNTPVLMAERMHMGIDLSTIYKGEIKIKNIDIENGGVRVFVQKDGYSNLSIIKKHPKKSNNKGLENLNSWVHKLGDLSFKSFEMTFYDSTTTKQYGAILVDARNNMIENDTAIEANLKGRVYFRGLVFKPEKGGFLVNQETLLNLHFSYNESHRRLTILPSTLETVKKDIIDINGGFFLRDSIKHFQLAFNSKGIEVDNALPLLQKTLSQKIDSLGIKTVVEVDVHIKGKLQPGEKPKSVVVFKTSPFTYKLPMGSLNKVQIAANYTNQADTNKLPGPKNASLTSTQTRGMFESLPFQLKFVINDLTNPHALLDGHIIADSIKLDGVLDPGTYRFKKGSAAIDFHFDGNIKNFYNAKTDVLNGVLYGKVSLKNLAVDYIPRGVHLSNINGVFVFNHRAVVFPTFSFSDGVNKLFIKGRVIDLIPFLLGSSKPLRALVDINVPTMKLNWLETMLSPKTPDRKHHKKGKKSMRLTEVMDDVIDNMAIEATLRSNHLIYHSFNGTGVRGDFVISNNAMILKNFSMNAFGKGHFEVSGSLDNSGKGALPFVSLKGKIIDADIHTVFSSFSNFGQKTLTHENIRGILNSSFNFESRLTNDAKLVPSSMRGDLKIDFRNGYILNFEPFLKIKKLAFKNRSFEKVELAPIVNDLVLKGQEIEIKPMEIESNVVTLYVDGVYSFGQKTDINIQIPLSNLKKRDENYVLDIDNEKRKKGSNVYLRAVDEGGKVNMKLAFKRKEKDQKKGK